MRKRKLFSFLLLSWSIGLIAQTTIPVGASQTYKKIGDAYTTGIPATISGAYNIVLQSDYDPAGETYPITLGNKTGASTSNTITIKPATGVSKIIAPTLTGSTTTAPATFVDNLVLNQTTNSFYSPSLPSLSVGDIISGNGLSATGVRVSSVSNGVVTVTGISNSLTPIQLTTANAVGASWLATSSTGTITKITNATITSASTAVTLATAPTGITLVSGLLVGGDGIPTGTTINVVTDQMHFTISNAATAAGTTMYFTDATAGKSLSPLAFQVPVGNTSSFSIGSTVSGTGIPSGSTVSAISGNNLYITASSISSANFTYAQAIIVSANGSTNTSVGTIVLNGAQYVNIDGGSRANLTISNPYTDQNTIQFTGASNNTITNCTVKGCGKDATYANIYIGSSTQTAACNSNTISYCDICESGAKPSNGVYMHGKQTVFNTGNKVIYNNVYNIATVSNNQSFASIRMGNAYDTNATIENNKIYWTNDVNYGAFYNYQYGIIARGYSSVKNNIIGFKSSDSNPADIIKFTSTNVGRLYGIKIEGGTSLNHTVVSGNKFANIQFDSRSTNNVDPVLTGILTYNTASTYIDLDNNTFENLKLYNNGDPQAFSFAGFYVLTPNSTITNNIIRNIEVHSGTSTSFASYKTPVRGIYVDGTTTSTTITGNKVYSLSSGDVANTNATVDAYGIYCGATNVDKIEKNLIYDVTAQNSGKTAATYGIYINNSSTSTTPTVVKNNMIRLGTNMTTGNIIHGIYQKESSSTTGYKFNVYNNSVYIGGTIATGATGITSAFTRAISATGKLAELKNNILVNVRTGGTTGKHYAVNLANATDYSSSYLASNNNLFQIGGTLGSNVFGIVGVTDITDFATWKSTCTGFDAASINANPQYIDPTNATTPDLRINTNSAAVAAKGADLHTVVTDDYYGTSRSAISTPALGAYEFTYTSAATDYFKSAISGNWGTAATWQSSSDNTNWAIATSAPTSAAASVTIQNGHLIIITGANATAPAITVNGGGKLTLNDTYSLNATSLALQSDVNNGTATFVDLNTNGNATLGSASVQQYLTSGRNWYIASPLTTATSTVFSATGTNPLYYYVEPNGSNANTRWAQITSTGTALAPTRGYITNMDATVMSNQSNVIIFTGGSFNTGTITTAVNGVPALTRTPGVTKEGFNLIGNPYPSYLNIDGLQSNTDLEPTYWVRSYNSGYVFDTYNIPGAMSTGLSGKTVSSKIAPMQAFWLRVKSGSTSATIAFTNAMRAHQDDANNKFRAPKATSTTRQVLRLQVSNGSAVDEAVVYSHANASNGLDDYDSPKMSNGSKLIPELYTLAGGEQLAINGLNALPYETELPLGFSTGTSGNFSIAASELTNMDATMVILKDNVLNAEQQLVSGMPYSFSSNIVNSTARFSIIFRTSGTTTGTNKDKISDNAVFVNANNQIIISAPVETKIAIYNSLGQKQYESKLATNRLEITDKFQTGVYFVVLTVNGKSETFKEIIH